MKMAKSLDQKTRILFVATFICLYSFLSHAQNEILSEASQKQESREFSIETEYGQANFSLFAPSEEKEQAERVQFLLHQYAQQVFEYFKYVPEKTINIRLNFSAKRANGSATIFPRNMIVLNMFPPIGEGHLLISDDWLKGLIVHELVHIIHLEQTNGLLAFLTNVFGSVGRIGGVVPRWFTEGVAVWAETKFTTGGRLRHKGLIAQAKYFLSKPGFCHTLDCLDSPGEYPYGNYSYWVGGMFLDYLENLRPGALACIIKNNSYGLPFFLREPFEVCNGLVDSMEGLFQRFIHETLTKEYALNPLMEEIKPIEAYAKGQPMFERSYEVVGDKLYWVEQDFDKTRLVHFNLTDQNRIDEKKLYHIDQVTKANSELILTTSDYRRLWVPREVRNLSNQIITRGDYYMNDQSAWSYSKNRWRLKNLNGDEVLSLPAFTNILDAKNDTFVTQSDTGYQVFRLGDTKPVRVSDKAIRLQSVCSEAVFLKEEDSLVLVSGDSEYVLQNNWTQDLISLRSGETHTVFRFSSKPSLLYSWDKGCRELVAMVQEKGEKKEKTFLKREEISQPDLNFAYRNYPQLKHFRPHWWFFSYVTGDVISQLTLSTSINDPLDRHRLSLNLTYFDGVDKIHPTGTYTYNWAGTDIGFGVTQSYVDNIARTSPDKDSSYFAFIGRSFFWRNLSYRLEVQASYFEESDVISSRKGREPIIINQLSLSPLFLDDFFRGLTFVSLTRYLDVDNGQSYWGEELRLRGIVQPLRRLNTTLQMSYGKLFKDNIRDGILYSGSANDYDTNTLHEFIGLGQNSSFGNEVTTARVQFDYELYRLQRSLGISPFFIRTLNGIVGSDYLKTDFIYTPNFFARDSFAQSYYAGLRANVTLAYFVPLQLDVLQVHVDRDLGEDTTDSRFFLRGNLPF